MVELYDIPPIDPRTREMLLGEMCMSLKSKGFKVTEDDGELLSVLTVLYSHMLAGTIKRLNRTPEKHRAAFLNLAHTPPRPAWSSSGIVAFDVVSGYDSPVTISRGTRMVSDSGAQPISFRLCSDVTAVPTAIADIYWFDAYRGRYGCSQSLSHLRPWQKDTTQELAYKADFIFENIFYNHNKAKLFIEASLQSRSISLSDLLNTTRWSFSLWPQSSPEFLDLCVSENQDGGLLVQTREPVTDSEYICIRMELTNPGYADIRISGTRLVQVSGSALPDTILTSGRGLNASAFYPFGEQLSAFEECGIFCDAALSQRSAEITVRFDLELEISEQWPEEPQEAVDYKWIMRKPIPKPKPVIYEAFAQAVRLEYWNGETYREIHDKSGRVLDFTHDNPRVELSFICPDDIMPCEYYGKTGYYLRLSCGGCEELYKLPRRVHTPYIRNLSFSYVHSMEYSPICVESESFGKRSEINLGAEPQIGLFERPANERMLLWGFDKLAWKCRLKMYIDIDNTEIQNVKEKKQSLNALLCRAQTSDTLPTHDFTDALNTSGGLWLDIPENAQTNVLFGKERHWVALCYDSQAEPAISGIYLNAEFAVNRNRYEENFSYTHLKDCRITLARVNIIRAWISVRSLTDDKMELWREYKNADGKFREGFYKISYSDGLITFPHDITGRGIIEDSLDLIQVVYDATDGEAANVPANSITRMEEDIPFIQSVRNPFAIVSGANSESGGELATRKQHELYNGGRIISKRDFELSAIDNCPLVCDAKCTYYAESKMVILAVRIVKAGQQSVFEKVKRGLLHHFSALVREGIRLDIIPWEELT